MRETAPFAVILTLAVAVILSTSGCARSAGPPAIAPGAPCAACGMGVQDMHFACEREVGGRWRVYDAIECLLRDAGAGSAGRVYLADYDRQSATVRWDHSGSSASLRTGCHCRSTRSVSCRERPR